jgi:SRSO17 transposase
MEGRSMDVDWQADLDRWLAPFVSALRHKTRARMCPAYIAGLIGPGDRKSIQPMAARAGEVGYDQLHHFVAAGVWDSAPLEATLLKEADDLVGDDAGFLVIDDTALPKKGRHSVGVTICLVAGKDCQLSVVGLGNVGVARGASDGGPAAIPARELDR